MPSRPGSASTTLRSALTGPYPTLRAEALRLVALALEAPTIGEAAERLGLARRALEKIRAEVPEAFRGVGRDSRKK